MNEEIKRAITEKIRSADRVILCRHVRPDGDAVGSSLGFRRALRLSFPEKEIYSIGTDASDYVGFLGSDDPALPEEAYENALVILLDTATPDRAANPFAFTAKNIVKIDHHEDVTPYGSLQWVEPERSATSEMIADLLFSDPDTYKIDIEAATDLFVGIVTDSGRFRYSCTSGETMRIAGRLMDFGIETEPIYSRLYLDDFGTMPYRAYVCGNVRKTENGVLSFYIDQKTQKELGLSREQASDGLLYMEGIRDCLIWLAFIENEDGTIRVRLRSRFVTVNGLASRYRGGGHDRASGATVYSLDEMEALIAEADELLGEYKKNNEGWV